MVRPMEIKMCEFGPRNMIELMFKLRSFACSSGTCRNVFLMAILQCEAHVSKWKDLV